MNRNIATFKVEGHGEFEIHTSPTIAEKFEIQREIDRLIGGSENALDYRAKILEYQKKISERIQHDDEKMAHMLDISFFMQLKEPLELAYQYATLKILTVKSPVEYIKLEEQQLQKIYSAYEVALKPFR